MMNNIYVFREFNEKHASDLWRSALIYNAVLIIVFFGGYTLGFSPLSLLSGTLVALIAAHIVRIFEIRQTKTVTLTKAQAVAAIVGSVAMFSVIVALYAILLYSATNPPPLSQAKPSPYWGLFSGLYLVKFGSMWTDFYVVHLFGKSQSA